MIKETYIGGDYLLVWSGAIELDSLALYKNSNGVLELLDQVYLIRKDIETHSWELYKKILDEGEVTPEWEDFFG